MLVRQSSKTDLKLRWFDQSRFGMFIHFGLYALLGRGEWVMYNENIPRSEYEKLMLRFNPFRFNADEWVDLAIAAGARYINVTAKHHDGFCLFDSKLTDYKITNTPFKRDLIGELVDACHRKSMRIILYYSQPDWHHPNFVHRKGVWKDLQNPPPTDRPDWPKYLEYLKDQVGELVTNYGRIDGIWFDGSHKTEKDWHGKELYRLIKHFQPAAVVNDRAQYGDFFTPERSLPEDLTGYLFEACESVSVTQWGYTKDRTSHSVPHLMQSLVRMAAAGGNYLLNVGPKPDGTIPAEQAEIMKKIGAWLRINGESVYRTQPVPLRQKPEDVLTTKTGNNLYLHLLHWPSENRILIPSIQSLPGKAMLLGSRHSLRVQKTGGGLEIRNLPPVPANTSVNVIRLCFKKPARLTLPFPPGRSRPVTTLNRPGKVRLTAGAACLSGRWVKGSSLEVRQIAAEDAQTGKDKNLCISRWYGLEQTADWHLECFQPGKYRVFIILSCPKIYAGSKFIIEVDSQKIKGVVPDTNSFDHFQRREVGRVTLGKGRLRLRLKPTFMPYGYIFADVARIELEKL
ncbi:MAG: alpha-L-fucosidase [Candidatus Omnitrophota bacterium]